MAPSVGDMLWVLNCPTISVWNTNFYGRSSILHIKISLNKEVSGVYQQLPAKETENTLFSYPNGEK